MHHVKVHRLNCQLPVHQQQLSLYIHWEKELPFTRSAITYHSALWNLKPRLQEAFSQLPLRKYKRMKISAKTVFSLLRKWSFTMTFLLVYVPFHKIVTFRFSLTNVLSVSTLRHSTLKCKSTENQYLKWVRSLQLHL